MVIAAPQRTGGPAPCRPWRRAGAAPKIVESERVDHASLEDERTIPVHLVDEREPGEAKDWNLCSRKLRTLRNCFHNQRGASSALRPMLFVSVCITGRRCSKYWRVMTDHPKPPAGRISPPGRQAVHCARRSRCP